MDFRASRIEKFDCRHCGGRVETGSAALLSSMACPHCGQMVDVPALFDRFVLETQLGRGGGGVVFRAHDVQLHRSVAVKVLLSADDQEELTRQCIREAQMLATINHRSIVSIYALGEYRGQPYMVMELLTGGDLRQFTEPGRTLGERESLDMGLAVAGGLRAAQRVGLVHMDIKPSNILLDADGQPKLIDFGAAQFRMRVKELGLVGTPFYIAPETAMKKIPTYKSDMYGLGATLFHVLTGQPPFRGATPKDTIAMRLHRAAPRVRQFCDWIHSETDDVVARMLEMDPEKRPRTYDELLAALEAARAATGPRPTAHAAVPSAAPFSPPPGAGALLPVPPAVPSPPAAPDLPAASAEAAASASPLEADVLQPSVQPPDERRSAARAVTAASPAGRGRQGRSSRRPNATPAAARTAGTVPRRKSKTAPALAILGILLVAVIGVAAWGVSRQGGIRGLLGGRRTTDPATPTGDFDPEDARYTGGHDAGHSIGPWHGKPHAHASGPSSAARQTLVAHWTFDNNLFETSGFQGYHAAWQGADGTYVPGRIDRALQLAPQQQVSIAHTIIPAAKAFTLALWILPPAEPATTPSQPATTPKQPATAPQQPATPQQAATPGQEPQEPSVNPQQSAASPNEPSAAPQEAAAPVEQGVVIGTGSCPLRLELAGRRVVARLAPPSATPHQDDTAPPDSAKGGELVGSLGPADAAHPWTHVALTYDHAADQWQLFVNGQPQGSQRLGGVPSFNVGPLLLSMPGKGAIDDLRIYNYVLSPAEIAGLQNAPPPAVAPKQKKHRR